MPSSLSLLSFADHPPEGSLQVDLDALLEFGLFIEGVSRSGKSNLVRALCEQTFGLVQQVIIDPEGEYATLRSADRPYLVVGAGRDVALPAAPEAVRRLVVRLVETGVSTVFDLSEYDLEEQQPIVAAICDALVRLPEGQPRDVLLIIEELQDFAAEGGGRGGSLPAVRRVAKRGRKRGVTLIGSSQRVADVSKGVITQLKNKAIGGTDHVDAPRALEELGLPRTARAEVTELPQGTFQVKGPALSRHAVRVQVPRAETATAKRRRGEPPAPAPEASAEIAALARELAAAVAPVEDDAATVVSGGGVSQEEVAARVAAAVADAEGQMHANQYMILNFLRDAQGTLAEAIRLLDGAPAAALSTVTADAADVERAVATRPQPTRPTTTPSAAASSSPDVESRILDTLRGFEALGVPAVPRTMLAAMVGFAPSTKAYTYAISACRSSGTVEVAGSGTLALTAEGRRQAKRSVSPPTLAALHEAWQKRLGDAEWKILTALASVYPKSIERTALAARCGYAPSTKAFTYGLSTLRTFGLVAPAGRGAFAATALYFPEGLR